MSPACPASASRPPRSSSANTAISKRCWQRAGEIKQEKRRQSLIDNAKLALLSKQLVTLDDKVALEVPLVDLAVHEPDYRRLIAFLKAMEFTTLYAAGS